MFELFMSNFDEKFLHFMESIKSERCDLRMLLRDDLRGKVDLRESRRVGNTNLKTLAITGDIYRKLQALSVENSAISLRSIMLIAFHCALGAYGQEGFSVIAYLQHGSENKKTTTVPTVFHHGKDSDAFEINSVETKLSGVTESDTSDNFGNPQLYDAAFVLRTDHEKSKHLENFLLSLYVGPNKDHTEIILELHYPDSLFDDGAVHGLLQLVSNLVKQFLANPTRSIDDIELLSCEEKEKLDLWNATEGDFPTDKRLNNLFEDAVSRTPNNQAIVCGSTGLTYKELNQQAEQFAYVLVEEQNIQPEDVVALFLDKRYVTIILILALWKVGVAFVPIDPDYPPSRIRHILADTKAKYLITNKRLVAQLYRLIPDVDQEVKILESENISKLGSFRSLNICRPMISSDNPAYIYYTSGTTGIPKGVIKSHKSVVNSITDLSERYGMLQSGEERIALYSSYVFEPFIRQMLIALINSQTLVIVPKDVTLDPLSLPPFIIEHGITYLNGTGSVLQHCDFKPCTSLKKLLLVGEELTSTRLKKIREKFTGVIYNEYSFTETALVTAIKRFEPEETVRTNRSIGRPLRNVKCYVLSPNQKRLPVGVVGELFVGGQGIASGYLNRDELTAKVFLPNPFRSEEDLHRKCNEHIYKTGDLARILPNGEIEFLGRIDYQIKLNGIRVELGEIETRVMEYPGILQCVVVLMEHADDDTLFLMGFYTGEQNIAESDLIDFLRIHLPSNMIPSQMVQLEKFPLNANGKIDRHALNRLTRSNRQRICNSVPKSGDSIAQKEEIMLSQIRRIWGIVLAIAPNAITDDDDFFALGGQSISCIRLISRIWEQLHIPLSLEELRVHRQLGKLAKHLTGRSPELVTNSDKPPTFDNGFKLRANGLQQGLVYEALKNGGVDDTYILQSVYRYHCPISETLMRQAWSYVHEKYPSLRLKFEWDHEPFQIVDTQSSEIDWRFVDLTMESKPEETCLSIQRQDRFEPYVLSKAPLYRVYFIKESTDAYSLIFSCHHILLDGWSLRNLLDQVHHTYLSLLQAQPISRVSDRSYFESQLYWLAHRQDHLEYWQKELDRISERSDLAGLLNAASRYTVELANYDSITDPKSKRLVIDSATVRLLKESCSKHQLTLHSILQFVWHKVLYSIGGSPTTVVGTVVSGRNLPVTDIEYAVGLFINTLPLIIDHSKLAELSIAQAVSDIQDAVNKMISCSTVELGQLSSSSLKHQLFDSLLVFENYPESVYISESSRYDLLQCVHEFDVEKVDYPLTIVAREKGNELTIDLWYAGELFDGDVIDSLLDSTRTLFSQVATNILTTVNELCVISSSTAAVFDDWNKTDASYADKKTLHKAFEENACQWADENAIVDGHLRLSYRELNEQANQLAHYLLSLSSTNTDCLIAIVMRKSHLLIKTILATWKAGGAFVPIDPDYSDERISFMLQDTKVQFILTTTDLIDRMKNLSGKEMRFVLAIDTIFVASRSKTNPNTKTSEKNLAYAIYTSGTTGKPKAVLVEHKGVMNLHYALKELFSLDKVISRESILSFSNFIFDHFIEQMTNALLNGHRLVILNDNLRTNPQELYKYMRDNEVTYLSGTPSVLSMYDFSTIPTLTKIDAIGEDLSITLFNKIRSSFSKLIINGYGPTEISITSHKKLYGPGEFRNNKSIGQPISNTKCYVLNSFLKRLPVGGIGELYIGGVGVTRGYLNQNQLTKEKFITNPFQTAEEKLHETNVKLYRTGDLVRWLPHGELEYLGRNDQQVKINGQRVELGEVEATLSSLPGITQSIVIARTHTTDLDQKFLVAFYISEQEFEEKELIENLKKKLPQILVPRRVLRIDKLPVTASGKLDIHSLPDCTLEYTKTTSFYPTTDIQIALCRIWSDILDLNPEIIGINDDFFAVGGDSFRAIKLAQTITSHFAIDFGLALVFEHRTISTQAVHLEQLSSLDKTYVENSPVTESNYSKTRASFGQENLLFIDKFANGTPAYNIPFAIELNPELNVSSIKMALQTIVTRHSALRTVFVEDADDIHLQQELDPQKALSLLHIPELNLNSLKDLDRLIINQTKELFDLRKLLPIRCAIVTLDEAPNRVFLVVVVHHICFDGWSLQVFLNDLKNLLLGRSDITIDWPKQSYLDFTNWQRQKLTPQRLSELTDFWSNKLRNFQVLNLPLDKSRPIEFDFHGAELTFTIDAGLLNELKILARKAKVSLFTVLLAAYFITLKVYSCQEDIVVGIPSANRENPFFSRIIGLFANLIVIRSHVTSKQNLSDYLHSLSTEIMYAQVHQDLPFELIVKSQNVARDTRLHPVVQTVFSLMPSIEMDTQDQNSPLKKIHTLTENEHTTAKFDLSVAVTEFPDELEINFTYATSLFEKSTIQKMAKTYQQVLRQFAEQRLASDKFTMSNLEYVDLAPPKDTLAKLQHPHPLGTVHSTFEKVVVENSASTAIIFGDTVLSYSELNERANKLAHYITDVLKKTTNMLIALVMEKSDQMIVAILAVWKAGAAYVPLDPIYPDERIEYIIRNSGAKLIFTDNEQLVRVESLLDYDTNLKVVAIQDLQLCNYSTDNLDLPSEATDIAYAIYTSGTSGTPKAVLINHQNIASFFDGIMRSGYFEITNHKQDTVLLLANYVFDFSIEQIVLALLRGNRLLIPISQEINQAFYEYANQNKLSYLSGPPTQVEQINLAQLQHLRLLLVAGEPFLPHHFNKFRKEFSGLILNAYGTTETTVYNSIHCFEKDDKYRNTLGKPLSNTSFHILGNDMVQVPIGAIGELYISGNCVSSGYLNEPHMTRNSFLPNPFQNSADENFDPTTVMYKTGDLVRLRSDQSIEFIGRNDAQIKIRGIRIELGEVENAIASYPNIQRCAVIPHKTKEEIVDGLAAFFSASVKIDKIDLLKFLRMKLIPSLIPNWLVQIQEMPLTINGKLNTEVLMDGFVNEYDSINVLPQNRLEKLIYNIWCKHLPTNEFGVTDNFFLLGGNSLSALHIMSTLQRELHCKINVKQIFQFPTIRSFIQNCNLSIPDYEFGEQGNLIGVCPLLPIQDWFFSKQIHFRAHWNQQFAIRTQPLDIIKLKAAVDVLTEHHDAFQLRFRTLPSNEHKIEQFYSNSLDKDNLHVIDIRDLKSDELQERLTNLQSNFDLELGPMHCVAYLYGFEDGSARIWFAMHHLITDVVSWSIIVRDLERIYQEKSIGKRISSYRQWAKFIQQYVTEPQDVEYWTQIQQAIELDSAQNRLRGPFNNKYRMTFKLSAQTSQILLTDGNTAYDTHTVDLLLTAIGAALYPITSKKTNYILFESHGREQFLDAPDVSNSVGWFTTTYPITLQTTENFENDIIQTKTNRLQTSYRGLGYGVFKRKYGYSSFGVPFASFNFLGIQGGHFVGKDIQMNWEIDPVFCGISRIDNHSECPIDITISFIDRHLIAEINCYKKETLEAFCTNLNLQLKSLARHTVLAGKKMFTQKSTSEDVLPVLDPYITINERAEQTLFVLPPGDGGAESYLANLALHLTDPKLIIFNNIHLQSPMTSFQEIAEYYIQQLLKVDPKGPYNLLGWSFGGVVAFEMALQLAQSGRQISNIFFIDSFFDVSKALSNLKLTNRFIDLDPINERYTPDESQIKKLLRFEPNLLLFKAETIDNSVTQTKQELFHHYIQAPYNNLDSYVPRNSISVLPMTNATHFSWISNSELVRNMALLIENCLYVGADKKS